MTAKAQTSGGRTQGFALDRFAIIHPASMTEEWTNFFRLSVTLRESVEPDTLQEALAAITPRFPTIVAGLRENGRNYEVVPAAQPPRVQPEGNWLAPMRPDEMECCALRVFWQGSRISVEIFHALTDGYGGLTFLKTLTAEYLCVRYGLDLSVICDSQILSINQPPDMAELRDDYPQYTARIAARRNGVRSYQLPREDEPLGSVQVITGVLPAERVKDVAKAHRVSVTALLAGATAQAIAQIQRQEQGREAKRPVQIMVPVDLRRRFMSRTLRNFSLYAVVRACPVQATGSLEQQLRCIQEQLEEQTGLSSLRRSITANMRLSENLMLKVLPLRLKCRLLRGGFRLFGQFSACLSVSNLGEVSIPAPVAGWVQGMDCCLTPRIPSLVNCGILTCNGVMRISFSRRRWMPVLEELFFEKLIHLGLVPDFECNGQPIGMERIFPKLYARAGSSSGR